MQYLYIHIIVTQYIIITYVDTHLNGTHCIHIYLIPTCRARQLCRIRYNITLLYCTHNIVKRTKSVFK